MPQFHLFSVMLCTNGLISGSLRCNVDVRPSLFVFFSIGLNVILIVSPATATYGSDVTLMCVVRSGDEPYTYTWMGPEGSSRTTNIITQSITFSAVEEDAGTYQCTAQDTSSTTGSDTATLTVGRSTTQCSNYMIPNFYFMTCIISPQFQPY